MSERNSCCLLQANFNLGNVYRQTGHFEAAVYCYETVTQTSPGHWRGLLNLSVALMGLGKTSDAQKALKHAFKASGKRLTPPGTPGTCLHTCTTSLPTCLDMPGSCSRVQGVSRRIPHAGVARIGGKFVTTPLPAGPSTRRAPAHVASLGVCSCSGANEVDGQE